MGDVVLAEFRVMLVEQVFNDGRDFATTAGKR